MVAFRWLVAVLVTVVTLFGGAFRPPTAAVRAHLAIQSASHDAKQATLDASRPIVQARATKPSPLDPRDRVGVASTATPNVQLVPSEATDTTARAPSTPDALPRVRTHAKHMVFLI